MHSYKINKSTIWPYLTVLEEFANIFIKEKYIKLDDLPHKR